MKISNIKIVLTNAESTKCRATASFLIDDCFVVKGVRVIEKEPGLFFIAMPNVQKEAGIFFDICHPINQKTRNLLTEAILDAYHQKVVDEA